MWFRLLLLCCSCLHLLQCIRLFVVNYGRIIWIVLSERSSVLTLNFFTFGVHQRFIVNLDITVLPLQFLVLHYEVSQIFEVQMLRQLLPYLYSLISKNFFSSSFTTKLTSSRSCNLLFHTDLVNCGYLCSLSQLP